MDNREYNQNENEESKVTSDINKINSEILEMELDEANMKIAECQRYNRLQEDYFQKEIKSVRRWRLLACIISVIVGLVAGGLVAGIIVFKTATNSSNAWIINKKTGDEAVSNRVADKLDSLQAIIDYLYLGDVDEEAIEEGIYKGYMEALGDPYSVYYTKDEYTELMESSSGTFYGIGVYVTQDPDTNEVTIMGVIEGGPAEEAGIKEGDVILKVNDEDIASMDVNTVVSKIKGGEGETVKITVKRTSDDETKSLDFNVERRSVETKTVSYEMLDDKVGYVRIAQFEETTVNQFKKAIDDLNDQGMKKLVIDLRDNPGGLLDSVCEILDYILPKGLIVYTEDKYGEREEEYSDEETHLSVPLSVLINGNSASASEVFAGAIQDYGVGKLVGTTSFGKGIVQVVRGLSDGSGVKVTVSKYYTPNGRNIHETGLEPDVEVELDESITNDNYTLETDNQLQKAIEEAK